MIVVRFGGGLGNQLFQYALLLSLTEKYGKDNIKYDDSSYLYFNEHEGFDLPKYFLFSESRMAIDDLRRVSTIKYYLAKKKKKISNLKIFNLLYKIDRVTTFVQKKDKNIIRDKHVTSLNSLQISVDNFCYFDGRWQNIKLYDLDFIRQGIRFNIDVSDSDKKVEDAINKNHSIGIHIRRGDFVSNAGFNICSIKYYKTAIDTVVKKSLMNLDDFNLFFFGDDHEFIKRNFEYSNMFIVNGSSAGADMYLMSKCECNVIANSTFSFWGAFLNKRAKVIVAPKYSFYSDARKELFSIPEEWIRIDNLERDI